MARFSFIFALAFGMLSVMAAAVPAPDGMHQGRLVRRGFSFAQLFHTIYAFFHRPVRHGFFGLFHRQHPHNNTLPSDSKNTTNATTTNQNSTIANVTVSITQNATNITTTGQNSTIANTTANATLTTSDKSAVVVNSTTGWEITKNTTYFGQKEKDDKTDKQEIQKIMQKFVLA